MNIECRTTRWTSSVLVCAGSWCRFLDARSPNVDTLKERKIDGHRRRGKDDGAVDAKVTWEPTEALRSLDQRANQRSEVSG